MWWIEAIVWALVAVVLVVAAVVVWFVGSIVRMRSILASQLGAKAHVAPINPLQCIKLIQALKDRPAARVAHGDRHFSAGVELALEACLPRNDGTPPLFSGTDVATIPTTAGRDILGRPSRGPTLYYMGPSIRYQVRLAPAPATAECSVSNDCVCKSIPLLQKTIEVIAPCRVVTDVVEHRS